MNRPYQDLKLLDFQKKFKTKEDCERLFLNLLSIFQDLIPASSEKGACIFKQIKCYEKK